MSGRYERINGQDEEDFGARNNNNNNNLSHPIPHSPPPSFHSRSSSPQPTRQVDATLADAFDDDDDSDDEVDDRRRLMRQNSTPSMENVNTIPTPAQPAVPAPTPSGSRSTRIVGGGSGSDGVFANLSARPERGNSDPEKDELPPSYEQAAADAAPPYWETTILAPGMGGPDEVYIDGMPVGSFFSFVWNGMISTSFQLVGFLLTYLLHSTHAAKNGSRAGLGITLIQYGFYMKGVSEDEPPAMSGPDGYAAPPDPNSHNFKQGDVTDDDLGSISGGEWLGYVLMRLFSINMAWTCSGDTNSALIENMWKNGLITDPRVKEAFLKVDRAHYAPAMPYEDSPQPIGYSATISAPHMHASAIEHVLSYLLPSSTSPAPRVLDVGSGSGYLTHVMAELVGEKGLVVGLEHIRELKELGETNMSKSVEGRRLLESGKVRFRFGDGRKGWVEEPREGEKDEGTGWDVIHVGASAVEIHPELLEQLKAPGCMFIPVDDDKMGYNQHVWRIEKDGNGEITKKKLFGVRYVPLTEAPKA
ncbi:protein-L-isoaspartate(D-aspartate) O-methyltransferase [Fusarium fujikuroi]|nr:protein-L-isoaspartate(D-aspartate) O-methyltransferase [Fusarium fujikuroi]